MTKRTEEEMVKIFLKKNKIKVIPEIGVAVEEKKIRCKSLYEIAESYSNSGEALAS